MYFMSTPVSSIGSVEANCVVTAQCARERAAARAAISIEIYARENKKRAEGQTEPKSQLHPVIESFS
jgi:hypothetical protein